MIQRAKLISNATRTIGAFMRTLPVVQSGSRPEAAGRTAGLQIMRETGRPRTDKFIQLEDTRTEAGPILPAPLEACG